MYKKEKTQNEILSSNINRLLAEKGWSQNELGRKLGVSAMAVNKWVRGISCPRDEVMDKMCRLFNVSRSELNTDRETLQGMSVLPANPIRMIGQVIIEDGELHEDSFDGYFFIDNSIRADYCMRMQGDSMKDAGIHHGNIVFLKKNYNNHVLSGNIYAVAHGDKPVAELKKVYQQGGGYLLMPCNQKYDPISVDDAVIFGECVGLYNHNCS